MSAALDLFYLDAGRYPTGAEGLEALVRPVTGIAAWNGPYVKGGKIPADPWGNAYVYASPGKNNQKGYDLSSVGPDGRSGTEDDIVNWDTRK